MSLENENGMGSRNKIYKKKVGDEDVVREEDYDACNDREKEKKNESRIPDSSEIRKSKFMIPGENFIV